MNFKLIMLLHYICFNNQIQYIFENYPRSLQPPYYKTQSLSSRKSLFSILFSLNSTSGAPTFFAQKRFLLGAAGHITPVAYRITSIKRQGRLLNFSIFFSHKIKKTYKIFKSLQYFYLPRHHFLHLYKVMSSKGQTIHAFYFIRMV